MKYFDAYFQTMKQAGLEPLSDVLQPKIEKFFTADRHGDLQKWEEALSKLPDLKPSELKLNQSVIEIGSKADLAETDPKVFEENLRAFHPWRKGPFSLFGVKIDTEWRSDMKWDRLAPHIAPLQDRTVLDVGCGSGYHAVRMAALGAQCVMGIDPTMLYVMQFQALEKYMNQKNVSVLPLGIDDLPDNTEAFDTVFSMGILYHRKSPIDHLTQLLGHLKEGGELILETLVIDEKDGDLLMPEDRYAQMRNVWFIPNCKTLKVWLRRAGYRNIRLLDVTQTTSEEQRSTSWMTFQSLADFLNPADSKKTIEGYPAPQRAMLIMER